MNSYLKMWILVLLLLLPSHASANIIYDFNIDGAGFSGSGTLGDLINNGNGLYTATSGAFTFQGDTYNLVLNSLNSSQATSPAGLFWFNNYIGPNNQFVLDNNGLLFRNSAGTELNIFFTGSNNLYSLYTGINGSYPISSLNNINFSMALDTTATPEPATLFLMGVGLIGGGLMRKRFKASSV